MWAVTVLKNSIHYYFSVYTFNYKCIEKIKKKCRSLFIHVSWVNMDSIIAVYMEMNFERTIKFAWIY